jgi:DegV family protein with EDD domain
MKIKITTDSTCDLSEELLKKNNIGVIPLHILMGGKDYLDRIDIGVGDIFNHVDAGGEISTTSAIPPYEYEAFFSKALDGYDALIHVNLSSKISSCHSNATLAAQQFKDVFVVDSLNLSTSQGLVAIEAARLAADRQYPIEDILSHLATLIQNLESSFVINRLDYLHKGGRCSAVAALGANLLNLKPCIEVSDGMMHVGKKYRGTYEKCIRQYVKDRLENRADIDYDTVLLTYTLGTASFAIDAAKEMIAQYGHFNNFLENQAGCTISSHCGPDTLGVLFARK